MPEREQGRYGVVLARIAADVTIEHAVFRLYVILTTYADIDGTCFPSVERLASDMGVSRRTVEKHLAVLVERGLIERIDRSAQGKSSITRLIDSPPAPSTGNPPALFDGSPPAPTAGHNTPREQPKRTGGAKRRRRSIDDTWEPSDAAKQQSVEKYPRIDHRRELERFRNFHIGRGSTFIDWDRAWMNWCDRATPAAPTQTRSAHTDRIEDLL